ncbi:hypothetical protein [Fructobacillus durionis]|uniref:Uncharacterized protein n=1 Tax=Fructobacillus durionis TaxID=283737 RepID=A0A1I1E0M1_9LACO|nr:hypothetical protein [Fructobacillus durionis]SFB78383.1 hypothetical protein SAMN05660453_0133 [Fructobacillus durionis]
MADYKINFKIDGREVTQEEIHEVELSRYHKVFKEFGEKNIPLQMNGQSYKVEDALEMTLEDARELLAQSKEAVGKQGMLDYYKDELIRADKMWEDIADKADDKQPMKQAIVEVETENISLIQFMLFNQSLMAENNLYLPSKVHPEHYYFEAGKGGTQTIVETFGMYKDPSYLHLVPGKGMARPIQPDADTDMVMIGKTLLAHNMADTKIIGMHQFKGKKNGLHVKLGVFLPQSAPDEILEGHKWHLMVEFNNGLHIAKDKKPNWLQKMILPLALKKAAKEFKE